MFHYAFTLKKNSNPVWISDYESHLTMLSTKYPHLDIEYHFEDTAGLHIHGMIRSPKKIHIRMIHPGNGWNLDMSFVKSPQAWDAYMTKDTIRETNLINEQYTLEYEYNEYNQTHYEDEPTDSDSEETSGIYKTINLFTRQPIPQ